MSMASLIGAESRGGDEFHSTMRRTGSAIINLAAVRDPGKRPFLKNKPTFTRARGRVVVAEEIGKIFREGKYHRTRCRTEIAAEVK